MQVLSLRLTRNYASTSALEQDKVARSELSTSAQLIVKSVNPKFVRRRDVKEDFIEWG